MTTTGLRPQPRFPEPDTEPFWEATKQHELKYQTCNKCSEVIFFPRRHCSRCGSDDTKWSVSKGEGTVYTFSVVMQSRHPAFKDLGAYSVASQVFDDPRKPALNTDGGGLSSNHPGERGIFLLLEATRQLRGESTSQVKDAKLAVAVGNGGQLGSRHATGATILAAD